MERCAQKKVRYLFLFYFYNQFLESILTAERWATAEELQNRPYSFLAAPTLEGGKEVLSRLKQTFGKDAVKYILLLKEERAKKPSKWPASLVTSQGSKTTMIASHGAMVSHILQCERGNVQLRESSTLFPLSGDKGKTTPIVVEEVYIFDQFSPEIQVEVLPTSEDLPPGEDLDYHSLHQGYAEKKNLTTVEENGKILFLKSSHDFDGYKMTQEMKEAFQVLEHLFQDVEDVFMNYAEILHNLEAQIEDELHFIEFADVDAGRCVKSYKRLQELRVKRRCMKDSMQLADLLVKNLGMDFPQRLQHISKKIQHWNQRTYTLRVPDEFQH